MKSILAYLDGVTKEYEAHEFFRYLERDDLDPDSQLSVFRHAAFFIMAFGDLNIFGLREDDAHDSWQKMVNKHSEEDGRHWPWYLADLKTLGHDKPTTFCANLKALWSKETQASRLLTFHLWSLIERNRGFMRFVAVEAIEATGYVLFSRLAPIADRRQKLQKEELIYFGEHHFSKELGHAMNDDCARAKLLDTTITEEEEIAAKEIIDDVFHLFRCWIDGLDALRHAD